MTNAAKITGGNKPMLTGYVRDSAGNGIANVQVELWKIEWGQTAMTRHALQPTDATGRYEFFPTPYRQTKYQTRVGSVVSADVLVQVHARLTITNPKPGTTLRVNEGFIYVSITPVANSIPIGISSVINGRYKWLQTRNTGPSGYTQFTANSFPRGTYTLVVYTSARQGMLYGSRSITLTIAD